MQKIAIVTGGNTGIGLETVRGLAQAKFTVVLACRELAKGEAARAGLGELASSVQVMHLDLADLQSVRKFCVEFQAAYTRLDVLVNNAGLWNTKRETTSDGFEATLGTNHIGHFALVNGLLELLKKSAPSRIVVLSSDLHKMGKMNWDDLEFKIEPFNGIAAYNRSKLANVLFVTELARRLAGTGVSVNAVHPGVVGTSLSRKMPAILGKIFNVFALTPARGALTSLHVALSEEGGRESGKYFTKARLANPSRAAQDAEAAARLWAWSESVTRP